MNYSAFAAQVCEAAAALVRVGLPASASTNGKSSLYLGNQVEVCIQTTDHPYADAHCVENSSEGGLSKNQLSFAAGFVASINWLAAAVWTNPIFESSIGDCLSLLPVYVAPTEIPPGLEMVWWASHYDDDAATLPPLEPTWLRARVKAICETRRACLNRTILASLQYVMLHEIAHFTLQHSTVLAAARDLWAEDEDKIAQASRALEIEADRWASLKLLRARYRSGNLVEGVPLEEILGILLVYIIQHARRLLSARIERPVPYPPLWFRSEDALIVNAWVRETSAKSVNPFRHEGRIARMVLQLGNTHPLMAEWLGPVIDGSRANSYSSVLTHAQQLREDLRGN